MSVVLSFMLTKTIGMWWIIYMMVWRKIWKIIPKGKWKFSAIPNNFGSGKIIILDFFFPQIYWASIVWTVTDWSEDPKAIVEKLRYNLADAWLWTFSSTFIEKPSLVNPVSLQAIKVPVIQEKRNHSASMLYPAHVAWSLLFSLRAEWWDMRPSSGLLKGPNPVSKSCSVCYYSITWLLEHIRQMSHHPWTTALMEASQD